MQKKLFNELVESMKDISESATPAQITRGPLLEKEVQKQCVDWARARGYWVRKFSSMSQRSVPDDLFARFLDGRRVKFAVEFKRPGAASTTAQRDEQEFMVRSGWLVLVIDNFEKFQWEVGRIEATCCTTEC